MLKYKEELLIDMKNLFYHHSNDLECLAKELEGADQELVQCMAQIKSLAKEKVLKRK
jgi:hypothetical protein